MLVTYLAFLVMEYIIENAIFVIINSVHNKNENVLKTVKTVLKTIKLTSSVYVCICKTNVVFSYI